MFKLFANGFISNDIEKDLSAAIEELKFYANKKDEIIDLVQTGTIRSNDRYTAVVFNKTVLDASWGTLGEAIKYLDRSKDMDRYYKIGHMLADYDQYYNGYNRNWVRSKNLLQTAWAGCTAAEFEAAKPALNQMFNELLVQAFENACKETGNHQIPTAGMIGGQCQRLQRKLEIELEVLKRDLKRRDA